MKDTVVTSSNILLPVLLNAGDSHWLIVGGDAKAYACLKKLLHSSDQLSITVINPVISQDIKKAGATHKNIILISRSYTALDLVDANMVIAATEDPFLNEQIRNEAVQQNNKVYVVGAPQLSDFILADHGVASKQNHISSHSFKNTDQGWRKLASRLILAFFLMVMGHIIISYLPMPSVKEIWIGIRPHFNYQFLFFILAGFLAQMVDGVLSMGYGVTSATCLISFGVNPVAMSAAIHTSEIFTTGISGYSHYKFGNVNKKLFRHLVVPGILGAILGAVLLVFLGEKGSRWLMPAVALYAGFLGLKILFKAFQQQHKSKKVQRVGWLAWIGGFLDSFGGGGWGPIVTSSLIAKGKSPKYTVGSVSLTEFFVTLSSAVTFFVTIGVSHWNIVLGLLIGGALAAPLAARLAGKLPRKTMMIAVGIMVMIWCVRLLIKSFI